MTEDEYWKEANELAQDSSRHEDIGDLGLWMIAAGIILMAVGLVYGIVRFAP